MMRNFDILGLWMKIMVVLCCFMVLAIVIVSVFLIIDFGLFQVVFVYFFWVQEIVFLIFWEVIGCIVCVNCYFVQKVVEVEIFQVVLLDIVFEVVVKIFYDFDSQQVLGDGFKGGLNVGVVLMLFEGFKIVFFDCLFEGFKEKVGGIYFQFYWEDMENVVIVGFLFGEQYQEIVFFVLFFDFVKDKSINYGKFVVYLGVNWGCG